MRTGNLRIHVPCDQGAWKALVESKYDASGRYVSEHTA